MSTRNLLIFKGVLFRRFRLNLYQPDVLAPIPARVWRWIGAM